MSRLGNGIGSVYKLSGKRKNPWVARKTVGFDMKGFPQYRYIGYYRTKADAMTALMDYNKSPYSLDNIPLSFVYDKFMTVYKEHHAPKTVHNIEISWDHLKPLHDNNITSLSRKKLQEYFDNLLVSEQVKQKVKSVLRQIYDTAVRYDYIQPEGTKVFDYLDLSSTIAVNKQNRDRFSDEEITRLKSIDDEMSHIVLFLIYTGLRAGEFCNMTDADIDDDLVLHVKKSKTSAGVREIPLSDKARKLLPLPHFDSYNDLKYAFTVWRDKNGFTRSLHCTRYTTISLLVSAGVDDRIVRAIVGHKAQNVTEKVYTKISNVDKRKALNLI